MSMETAPAQTKGGPPASTSAPASAPLRPRRIGGGQSLLAEAEPLVWLNGGALVVCVAMITGLLLLVVYQGSTTFWPVPLVQVTTVQGTKLLGEVTRHDRYELGYQDAAALTGEVRERAQKLLNPRFQEKLLALRESGQFTTELTRLADFVDRAVVKAAAVMPHVVDAPALERNELLDELRQLMTDRRTSLIGRVEMRIDEAIRPSDEGAGIFALWSEWKANEADWLAQTDVPAMRAALGKTPDLLDSIWGSHALTLLSYDIAVPVSRRLLRTGNFELTNVHFTWVSDFEVEPGSESRPEWAILFERLAWGRFYGFPAALHIDGSTVATEPAAIWSRFQELHPEVRQRWARRRKLEIVDTGEVNRLLEEARLHLRKVELDSGKDSAEWAQAQAAFRETKQRLDDRFAVIRTEIQELDRQNERYQLLVETADGQQASLALSEIVRTYAANQLSLTEKIGIYVSRWGEFLADDPREANSEGGVFPAIWGTVAMTLLMSLAVVPFGVLAALYLREYARAGMLVSTVRIAVNNLAGVPSIVFGVFGLGFFCYLIGASIDELFFEAKLPSPTFGTGGLMWASLTLALLTLPVVIVATEEALAAVPRSIREGSLACGATKWQTIRRIVLPRAMPGIMTGMILAMARGAGEVAPLMLVGAVKLAPELPIDGHFPFVHLERSFMHLGFHIYDLGFQSQNSEAAKPMVFTTTLLLIGLIALMNVLAIGLRARLRKRFSYSQF